MLDIRFIREKPNDFDSAMKKRGIPVRANDILPLDIQHREVQTQLQEAQSQRNTVSKHIGDIKKLREEPSTALADSMTLIKESITKMAVLENEIKTLLDEMLSGLPNIPDEEVPNGTDETFNEKIHHVGELPSIANPKEHFQLGEKLGMMDFGTAATLSGSRFTILKDQLAVLERALGNFMLDSLTDAGYTEISPPLMVNEKIMYGTGQLPKFKEDQFQTTDGKWLIPTAEVPLTNMVNGKIIERDQLPLHYVARTPCFRLEAGAAGKDTRGMMRQHQFYKVEMVSIVTADQSDVEHDRMTGCAEAILTMLKLPFRTMILCAGDMGFSAQKTYDIEVWLPGQNAYREISSCSNCGDFQARRMNARTRIAGEKTTEFVHTLNGSGVAVGRCLIAIMENYQQDDGSIIVPEVLRPYMKGLKVIK